MSKYQNYIDDSDDDVDEDEQDLCASDIEVIPNNTISKSLPRLRSECSKSNYSYPTNTNSSNSNYNHNKFQFNINDKETSPLSDIEEDPNKLLSTPMTEKERDIYTGMGIELIIEHGRAQGRYPSATVFISDWRITSIINSFDTILGRFGKTHDEFAIFCIWDKQKRPHSLAWEDVNSLYLPFYRTNFHFFLSKIQRKRGIKRGHEGTEIGEPYKKKQKDNKGKRNKTKQLLRAEAIQKIQINMEPKFTYWINSRLDKDQFWMRCAYFITQRQWSMKKLQRWLFVNYIQPEQQQAIDIAQSSTFTSSKPSASDINNITNDIVNARSCTSKPTKSIESIALNSKYYKAVMRSDMETVEEMTRKDTETKELNDNELALLWNKYKSKFKELSGIEEDEHKKESD